MTGSADCQSGPVLVTADPGILFVVWNRVIQALALSTRSLCRFPQPPFPPP